MQHIDLFSSFCWWGAVLVIPIYLLLSQQKKTKTLNRFRDLLVLKMEENPHICSRILWTPASSSQGCRITTDGVSPRWNLKCPEIIISYFILKVRFHAMSLHQSPVFELLWARRANVYQNDLCDFVFALSYSEILWCPRFPGFHPLLFDQPPAFNAAQSTILCFCSHTAPLSLQSSLLNQ